MEFSIPISVVMSTHNTEISMLQTAVESILSQTFREFEFIIIDDGSTDESVNYLNSLQDERIRLIRNPENLGLTKSLNIGLKAAKGNILPGWTRMTSPCRSALKSSTLTWKPIRT